MIRVLLCDDHRIVREGLRQVLADDADIMVCGEARTGTEALAQVQALMGAAPQGDRTGLDVVLLDIAMPERDGLEMARWPKYTGFSRSFGANIPACLC